MSKATPIPKIKLNPKEALEHHIDVAENKAQDRFSRAAAIIERRPSVFQEVSNPRDDMAVTGNTKASHPQEFSITQCVPGTVIRVPFHLIDVNPFGPRHIYKTEEIDKIALTLPDGQDDAAHGFVLGERIVLIDGGTRYRSAKVAGIGFLDVKIEEAPNDDLDLYLRARRYNEQRSQPSVIDHAMSLRRLLDDGIVASQRELIEKVPDVNGRDKMTESLISWYMRIARMPRNILERMSEHPTTSQLTVLFAVSEIFKKGEDATSEQIDLALQLIEKIRSQDLSRKQIEVLVRSRISNERQHRERSVQQPINVGGYKGQIKTFGKRGQLDLSLKGVSEDDLPQLQREIQAVIERFAQERQGVFGMTDSDTG